MEKLYDAFLVEKGLAEGDPVSVPELTARGDDGDEEEPLVLTTLKDLKGVNALATGQEIGFNARVTVLFGENGTGKTGMCES